MFTEIFAQIREELDNRDLKREEILRLNRKVIRECSEVIRVIHRKKYEEAEKNLHLIKEGIEKLSSLQRETKDLDYITSSVVAFQEYVEACLFLSFVKNSSIPSNKDLNIPLLSYILGMADTIGEIRRYILDSLRKNNLNEAERALNVMDELQMGLMTLDYPGGLIPGVRRKSDITRNLIEKTRGDLTNAISRQNLANKIDEISKK